MTSQPATEQTPMNGPDVLTTDLTKPALPRLSEAPVHRSTDMHLMHEALARAHCIEQHERASRSRRMRMLLAARRMDRRAARAAQRARRLAAAAVSLRDRA
jgi:hypothetical protein